MKNQTMYENPTNLSLGDLPFNSLDELKSKKADPNFSMELKVVDPITRKTRVMGCSSIAAIKNDGKHICGITFEAGVLKGVNSQRQPLHGVFDMTDPSKPKYKLYLG